MGEVLEARSADGTRIVSRVVGTGPPLVLVHGGLGDGDTSWPVMLPRLAEEHTCLPMSTRGRGLSDDADDHSAQRLVEDVLAVVGSADEPVDLLGYSSGALWTIGAAARADNVRRVVLYEPPVRIGGPLTSDDQLARIRAAVADGRLVDAARIGAEEIVKLDDDELEAFALPGVAERIAAQVAVWVRELPAIEVALDGVDLGALTPPVVLVVGDRTGQHHVDAVEHLAAALPDVTVRDLPGAGHLGPLSHGAELAEIVADELRPS